MLEVVCKVCINGVRVVFSSVNNMMCSLWLFYGTITYVFVYLKKEDEAPEQQKKHHTAVFTWWLLVTNWSRCLKSAPLIVWLQMILNICYIRQWWSYTTHPLAEAKLLTHCLISILTSFLAQRGKQGGRQGHKLPNFLFHFKTFHKGSKNMPKKSTYLQTPSTLAAKCLPI